MLRLLRSLLGNNSYRGGHSAPIRKANGGFRPALEILEDRITPSVTLDNPGSHSNYTGDSVHQALLAMDSDDNLLNFSAVNLPAGLGIDETTGDITGVLAPGAETDSPYSVSVTAIDTVNGDSDTQTFSWTISVTWVMLSAPNGSVTNYNGDSVYISTYAADNSCHPLTYSATGLPPGISFDSSYPATQVWGWDYPAVSGVLGSDAISDTPYAVTLIVTDAAADVSATQTFSWTVSQATLTLTNPGDQSSYDGDLVSLSLHAEDNAWHRVTFSADGLPPGLNMTEEGLIHGTMAADADAGSVYTVTLTATDSSAGVSDSQTFDWTVSPVTVSLTGPGDQSSFDGDAVNLSLSASDSAGHALTYSVDPTTPLPSGLSVSGNTIVGTIASDADQSGPYSVTVMATDSAANVSDSKTFSWAVSPVTVSLTNPGDQSYYHNAQVTLDLSATDSAGHGLIYTVDSATPLPEGLSLDSNTGEISGTMPIDAVSDTAYSVHITATDVAANVSDDTTFAITVLNHAPTASDQSLSMIHDTVLPDIAFATDADGDPLTPVVVSAASHGNAFIGDDGQVEYDPTAGWTGTDSFTVKANDGLVDTDTVTITITVTNTAPVASDATLAIEHDQVLTDIDLTQYVSDAEGDPLTITIGTQPAHGQLTNLFDSVYIYTPDSGYVGSDYFTISANDGTTDSNTATVTIDVTQYAPINSDNSYTVLHDHTLPNMRLTENDPDASQNPSILYIVSGPSHGTLVDNGDYTWDYTPDAGFYGTDTITISSPGEAPVDVTVNVIDHAPVALQTSIPIEAYGGVYQGMAFLADATDSDGTTLTVNFLSQPQHGSLVLNSTTGLYDYSATTGYLGLDSFSFQYYDGAEYSNTVTVSVLDYNDSVDVHSSLIQNFGPPTAPFDNGTPTRNLIQQGQIDACSFVATMASLVDNWPNWTVNLITPNANGTFTVNFPGGSGLVTITTPVGDGHTYSPANGDGIWLSVLEKAAGFEFFDLASVVVRWNYTPYDYINTGRFPQCVIPLVTAHNALDTTFRFTSDPTTSANLTTAFAGHKAVVASTYGSPGPGLVAYHSYGVVGWNATTQEVTLYNPQGSNPDYTYTTEDASGVHTFTDNLNPTGGQFTMSLREFTRAFSYIDYER